MRRYLWGLSLVLALLASSAHVGPVSAAPTFTLSTVESTTGGKTITVSVRLAKTAPAGGQRVALASSDRSVRVPDAVTVRAGRASVLASVKTAYVDRVTTATLSATIDGATRTVDVRVTPVKLSSLSLPTSLIGGVAGSGTIRRDSASSFPSVVALTSGSRSAVVPATVTIEANESSARFPVTTAAVAGDPTTVTVTATADGVTKTDTMKVMPASLASVGIKAALTAGASTTGKVRLTGPAPAGGATVALSLPDGSPLTIPASVTIPEGDSAAGFAVVAGSPAAKTTVKVTGRFAGVAKTASVLVSAGVQPVALDRIEVAAGSLVGGGSTEATVTLTRSADRATVVQLTSGDGAALSVPASVTIATGRTSATVAVQSGAVPSATDVSVVATLSGASRSATVTVLPATLVGLSTDAELTSDGAFTAVLTLDGVAPAGAVVKLESSEPKLVTVPDAVEVGAGETSAAFTVTTGSATEAIKFQLVASYADSKVAFTGVLLPAAPVGPAAFTPATFTFLPETETVLTLDLTGPAPADGMAINLEYSEGLWGEGVYKVEPGARSITVSVWAKYGVTGGTVVAYANDTKAVAEGTLAEASATLTVERAEVRGGGAIIVTVTLGAPAGESGQTIVVEGDNPELVEATKVWVAPGETTVTFKVATREVKEASVVTLSITDGPAASVAVTLVPRG